jgi:hypothetical protein
MEEAMETKSYTTIDRVALGWPSGEWDSEPDKVQWQDKKTGLPCLAVRHRDYGHWCGYVGVTDQHPWYGKDCDALNDNPDVHWGLTYADKCQPSDDESKGICHVPAPGEPDHVWWFGFDCAHSGDASPQDFAYWEKRGEVPYANYRSLSFVKNQCKKLAEQLFEVKQ